MKKLFGFIIATAFIVLIGIGIFINETQGKYYEVSANLVYLEPVYTVNKEQKAQEETKDLINTGIKFEVYFDTGDSEDSLKYTGKYTVYRKDFSFYVKVKPFSRLGLRLIFA